MLQNIKYITIIEKKCNRLGMLYIIGTVTGSGVGTFKIISRAVSSLVMSPSIPCSMRSSFASSETISPKYLLHLKYQSKLLYLYYLPFSIPPAMDDIEWFIYSDGSLHLHISLRQHRICDFFKGGDIGSGHVVVFYAETFCGF